MPSLEAAYAAHAGDYAWERWVEDLDAFWRALDLGRVPFLGHSMGAGHAMRFAALHPDHVESLVLVERPFAGMPTRSDQEAAFWASFAPLVPPEGFTSRDEYLDLAMATFPRASRQAVIDTSDDLVVGADGRWQWSHPADPAVLGLEISDSAERELIEAVRCPTLVVRAEHSELLTRHGLADLISAFARAELVELPDCGHIVMWENPAALAELIDDFVSQRSFGDA